MKSIQKLLMVLISFFSACSKEEKRSYLLHIRVIAPADYPISAYDEIKVTLTNKNQGITYSASCSSTGIASFNVEYGYYTASVYYQADPNTVLSGRIDNLSLLPKQNEVTAPKTDLQLSRVRSSALIFKEIYYTGCLGIQGEEYQLDQYITLCNNSTETIYLDGICIGMVAPSGNGESPWMKYTDMQRIPVYNMTWQFPGSGQEYPLLPGEETTIATNAVNHSEETYQQVNSIDLSEVDWGFSDQSLKNVIAPGVKSMNLLINLSPAWRYDLSVVGPALIIFKIKDSSAEAYVNDPANRERTPYASNKSRFYLMIPQEWVMDCVDCVESAKQVAFKRVPNTLDHTPAYIPGDFYSGQSLVRKKIVDSEGRTVYQDTNNSSEDLEVSIPTLKNKQ